MTTLSAKDVRQQFSTVLSSVARGRSVTVTRRGKPVARISPVAESRKTGLPDLASFRAKLKGQPGKTATIEDLRRADRY